MERSAFAEPVVYEPIPCKDGTYSLKHLPSGQAMHSAIGPWREARSVYADQSRIRERLSESSESPLILWDVGLGIGANALAAIECAESNGTSCRKFHIVSFECDVGGARSALEDAGRFQFSWLQREALESLISTGLWTSPNGRIHWTLRRGDFFEECAKAQLPDIVFYDFYSPATCPDLWSLESFTELRRLFGDKAVSLYTYSSATPVRAALLLAGFTVGAGTSTELKAETTVAAIYPRDVALPLGRDWLSHLDRSAQPVPYGKHELTSEETRSRISAVSQFQI